MTLPPDPAPSTSSSTLCITVLLFAAISFLVYKFILSAPLETQTQAIAPSSGTVVTPQRNAAASTSAAPRASRTINSSSGDNSSDDYFNYGTNRHPSHLIPPEKWDKSTTSLTKYLLNGIVPFRSTPANGYETRLQKELLSNDLIVTNRKNRARIFARLFSLTATDDGVKKPPPNRGANIVVTVYPSDASCDKLQKALMLLGTYYNLFVLVDASDLGDKSMKEQREFVKTFREEMIHINTQQTKAESSHQLNDQILPLHRIVFLSTTAGRVAFVRQLNGVELVVDGEEKVTKELSRFGHRVLVYPKGGGGESSALGKFLIP
jgi:hypothetical protein